MTKIIAWFSALPQWQLGHEEEGETALAQADGAHLLETINAIGGLYGIEFIHH
ncbi:MULTISPECIES: hypothetical protein [Yersinia]|uniref:Uncharacterized protein n=1 Tax=Yersinia bercovieri ATCC 43970 TaxID=349968 RepID=A0ABM9XV29_YERBE|nr:MULTISPECIES: hypothetical protein [Yersinia]EEQ05260.1 hypothetical protein yberc0001_19140 [Yersinia bercovieri ATCC 43970]MDN0103214.1 hypothetical protein [Yersinia bercovieri]QKJ07984.1 hypothetical protein HRK25_14485 [Yersinia bercovieri ATCC 43970]CFQ45986.1 Uncharacterised protein [Yersinia bercovieri]CNJ09139.1 Uncharacterised protein [Yersinia bercovieri]